MKIHTIVSGELDNNTYIITNNGAAVLIDANASPQYINQYLNGEKVVATLITHGHFDHIEHLEDIVKEYKCECFMSKNALPKLIDPKLNESFSFGSKPLSVNVDNVKVVQEGDKLDLIGLTFEVLDLPGHTDCGVGYIMDDIIFTGDTMFARGYGRTDLTTGDYSSLIKSLKKLLRYKGYKVLSGHGEEGKIGK